MMKVEELSLPREGMSVFNRDEKNERARAELVSALNEKAKTVRLVRSPMEALREAKEQAKIDDTQQ